ncbi:hypothetical protein GGP41_004313 [Bipolaris sorokiniana]|uniref:Uncharacterized protein n=1 Tax=Cochliobolus sativus TaxID=45130 RepID=A0A8H5ZPK7_COCSA|nr:hypothetical protein GGP41_004313 [Bipolaris sorokiniana]
MAWQAERIADSRLSIDAPIALLRRLLASFSIILDDTRNTEHVSPRVEKSTDEGRNMGCEFGEGGTSRPPPHVVPRCCPYRASISASAVSVHSACRGQGGMSTDPDLLNTWQPWLEHGVVEIGRFLWYHVVADWLPAQPYTVCESTFGCRRQNVLCFGQRAVAPQ